MARFLFHAPVLLGVGDESNSHRPSLQRPRIETPQPEYGDVRDVEQAPREKSRSRQAPFAAPLNAPEFPAVFLKTLWRTASSFAKRFDAIPLLF